MREKFGDGNIIIYKMDAHSWQKTAEEKKFMKDTYTTLEIQKI